MGKPTLARGEEAEPKAATSIGTSGASASAGAADSQREQRGSRRSLAEEGRMGTWESHVGVELEKGHEQNNILCISMCVIMNKYTFFLKIIYAYIHIDTILCV